MEIPLMQSSIGLKRLTRNTVSRQRDAAALAFDGRDERGPRLSAPDILPGNGWHSLKPPPQFKRVNAASLASSSTGRCGPNEGRSHVCTGDAMVSATLTLTPGLSVTRRDTVFRIPVGASAAGGEFDVHPKSSSFLMMQRGDQQRERLIVVFGWLEELKERMGGGTRR